MVFIDWHNYVLDSGRNCVTSDWWSRHEQIQYKFAVAVRPKNVTKEISSYRAEANRKEESEFWQRNQWKSDSTRNDGINLTK